MFIKQVSVFVENQSGKLSDVLEVLAENNIDISAMSVADKTDFGILRLIVNDYEKAEKVLKEHGYVVKLARVIGVGLEGKAGSLAKVLSMLKEHDVNIKYLYAFIGKSKYPAMVILRPDNPEEALKVLHENNIPIVQESEL